MRKTFREGFTLVELALSMAFIGILSVAVVLIISDTVASYRRGLTLAQVNTTGMDIVDDMRLAVSNSSSWALSEYCSRYYDGGTARSNCVSDGGYSFATAVKSANVKVNGKELGATPIFGAFCTGAYSYVWNSGYYEMDGADFAGKDTNWAVLKYMNNSRDVITVGLDRPFRLLKIHDTNRAVCMSAARPDKNTYLTQDKINFDKVFDISGIGVLDSAPEDLLASNSENSLALFDLFVAKPAESTTQKNMFYAVSFILGTVTGGVNIKASGQSCAAPSNYGVENFDYCAINKFNFAMQANGNGGI